MSAETRSNACDEQPMAEQLLRPASAPASMPISAPAPSTEEPVFATPSANKRRRQPATPSAADESKQFFSEIDKLISSVTSTQQKDASDNFGVMMAAQHRALNSEQQHYFLVQCQKAYVQALEYGTNVGVNVREHAPPQQLNDMGFSFLSYD